VQHGKVGDGHKCMQCALQPAFKSRAMASSAILCGHRIICLQHAMLSQHMQSSPMVSALGQLPPAMAKF
jgi:hypothetical protein